MATKKPIDTFEYNKFNTEGEVKVALSNSGSVLSTKVDIISTATLIPSSSLTDRKSMSIRNPGLYTVYLGGSGVSTTNGFPISSADSPVEFNISDNSDIYGIVVSTASSIRIIEFS